MMNDFHFAIRQLLKNPGFTAIAALTLALGIGANTAVFSVVNGILLKPLPYPQPDRLVTLWESAPGRGVAQEKVSGPNYLDWREQNTVFSDMAVCPGWDGATEFNLVLRDATVKIHATYASASLFSTFGQAPLLGRTLLPEEDRKEGNRSAVLGYGLWQRHFAGDPAVIGKSLTLDTYGRRDYTIVGVMPEGFGEPSECDLWLPMGWMGVTLDERRSAHWHHVIARLKPGVSIETARAQMNAIQSRIQQEHSNMLLGTEVAIVPLVEQAVGPNMRKALLILWGVVGGVLLIACVNVANLMLARGAARQQEIALRLALGAGRWRILRQLLAESVTLAALGGAAGAVLGHWSIQLLVAASPARLPRLAEVSLDPAALAFTAATALLTALIFGLAPAWQCSGPSVSHTLKEGSRSASPGLAAGRARSALVMAEIALATVLLAGAGLMLQSFAKLTAADRGFRADHLIAAELDFSVSGFTTWVRTNGNRPQLHLREALERLRQQPGVQAAGAASVFLRQNNLPPSQTISIFGRAAGRAEGKITTDIKGISPGFLDTLGVRLLRGRDFTEGDTLHAPSVALVNETFARRYFPNENPVGQRFTMSSPETPLDARDGHGLPFWSEIVGVVSDLKSLGAQPAAAPEVYRPYWQWPVYSPVLYMRSSGDPARLVAAMRSEIRAAIPDIPAPAVTLMTERVSESVAEPRFQAALLNVFGAIGLALAACGIYGSVAYSVSQRRKEIGIRMALGAGKRSVLSLIIREGMKLAVIGAAVGLLSGMALTRLLSALLYEIQPLSLPAFIAAPLLLLGAALIACWIPARRAAALDPMDALRSE